MIDDLYQKEKRYVRQYLREDFIENNSFIFDLQKSHALHTSKGINAEAALKEKVTGFGLYSIGGQPQVQGKNMAL